jgi:acetoin:2,6-dichlorophenolindophenol oxidoreductase subunit beta
MTTLTVQGAIHQALAEELARDADVLLFGEGVATQRHDLVQAFGADRVRNTPLAEAVIAGTAAGAAASGLRPVIDLLFAPFATYAMDALVNSAGKLRYLSGGQFSFPMVAMSLTGAGGCLGSQHNHNLEAMFVHAPGLKVVMPFQAADFKGLLKAAIRDDNPVLFFTDLALLQNAGEVPDDPDFVVPLGKAEILREGSDVTLVAYAKAVGLCLEAAKALEERGISAEIVDLRSLKPLDHDTVLRSLKKTGRLVVVHEANGICGVGAEISAHVAQHAWRHLRAPVMRITGPDSPAPSSWALEQATVPQLETIIRTALDLVLPETVAA